MITSKRKCPSCDGTDFAEGEIHGAYFQLRGDRAVLDLLLKHKPIKGAVCIDCGYLHHYVDGAELESIRTKARGSAADLR